MSPAAGEEQSAAEVGREMHQRFERRRPHPTGRHVLEDHGTIGGQRGKILRKGRWCDVSTLSLPAERATEIVGTARRVDQENRGWRIDPHGAIADIVVGHAIARAELQP